MRVEEWCQKLAQYDEAYREAPDAGIPDGRQVVTVESVGLRESQAGNRMLEWCLKIVEGEKQGRLLWTRHMLVVQGQEKEEKERKLGWLKHDLGVCGLSLERFSELPHKLPHLAGIKLDISKKTRQGGDGYQIYFNRLIPQETLETLEDGYEGDFNGEAGCGA